MDLPIACNLADEELRRRRQEIAGFFGKIGVTITELPNGYAYTFAAMSETLLRVAQLVDLERECCPFLQFNIVVGAGKEPMRLEVTGPQGAKTVIAEFFNCDL